jgi:hypothetical protein
VWLGFVLDPASVAGGTLTSIQIAPGTSITTSGVCTSTTVIDCTINSTGINGFPPPNWTVDPTTGDFTLNAGFVVASTNYGIYLHDATSGGTYGGIKLQQDTFEGIELDSGGDSGIGTGPINFLSKGGISAEDNSVNGVLVSTSSTGNININSSNGTGYINFTSSGGITATDTSNNGIILDSWVSPGIDTLANLTTQIATLLSEGYTKLCSDCDTPLIEGAVCTSAGDMAGAQALYIRGALHCF